MSKDEIFSFMDSEFGKKPEYLWEKFPKTCIFRKTKNKKWFAAFLEIPKSKLGLKGEQEINVLNVKCKKGFPAFIKGVKGIYPAYHMNKQTWISIALDEADDELVIDLIKESYEIS